MTGSSRPRLSYRLRRAAHDPTPWIAVALAVLLGYLVLGPLASLVSDALRVHSGDSATTGSDEGVWSLYYVRRVFVEPISKIFFWEPLVNTLIIAVGVTGLSLLLGGGLAWLTTRTDVRGGRWLSTALVVPYMMPSWTFALAWVTMFKNRRMAGQPGIAEGLGFSPPDWLAYGRLPIIVTLTLHYFPFAFLLIGNALRRVDSQLEEAARVLGAPPRVIARRIVIPLLLPAVMSAVLLTASKVLGTFGTPYVLGLPVRHAVLSTSLYDSYGTGDIGTTSVLSVVIVGIGLVFLLADLWLLREFRRFVTVGTKGAMLRTTRLGRWRNPLSAFAIGTVVLAVVVPLAVLVLSTITRVPGKFSLDNFTLEAWVAEHLPRAKSFPTGVLRSSELLEAARNSLIYIGGSAVLCGVIGLLIGYVVVRSSGRFGAVLRQISFVPYLIPGIAFATAYLSLFAVRRGPIPALYGTWVLLVIVLVVGQLPYASRSGISAVLQLGREPEEAAQIAGASWPRRMIHIVVPVLKGGLLIGIILPFVSGMKELSSIIMLSTGKTEVLTTLSVRLVDYGYADLANVVTLILVAITFVATFAAQRLTRTGLASGLEA